MTAKQKIIAGWVAFTFVTLHLLSVMIYAAPPEVVPHKAKAFVSPYVEPLFIQKWAMFVPAPETDGRVKMKFTYADDTSDWIYPTEDARYWYGILRSSHHAELILIEAAIIYWANFDRDKYEIELDKPMSSNVKSIFINEGQSFWLIWRYARRVGEIQGGEVPVSAEIEVELHNMRTGEKGAIIYPEMSW